MRGHVRKRRTWEFIVDIGPHPVTGRRRQKSKSGFATKREAESALHEVIRYIEGGGDPCPERIRLAAYLSRWLEYQRARGIRSRTLDWIRGVHPPGDRAGHRGYRGRQAQARPRSGGPAAPGIGRGHDRPGPRGARLRPAPGRGGRAHRREPGHRNQAPGGPTSRAALAQPGAARGKGLAMPI
jgi:hypothetical protein